MTGADPKSLFKKGVPIKVFPPQNGYSTWKFRCVKFLNHVLILELMHQSGLDAPFPYIQVSHPGLEKHEGDNKPRLYKDPDKRPSGDEDVELDFTGEGAEKFHGELTAEHQPAMFTLKKNPIVEKVRDKTRRVHNGPAIGIGTKDEVNDDNTVTTQDWVYGGKIPQIEFKLMKNVDVSLTKGLEEFLKMLEYMQRNYPHLTLNLGIVALPQQKSFSHYDNGGIRPTALVRVEQAGRLPCYVVEIGRADSWSISTLVIKPVDVSSLDNGAFEIYLNDLLHKLVDGNGHWDKDFFDGEKRYRIEMAKHMSGQTIERWSERVVEKL